MNPDLVRVGRFVLPRAKADFYAAWMRQHPEDRALLNQITAYSKRDINPFMPSTAESERLLAQVTDFCNRFTAALHEKFGDP